MDGEGGELRKIDKFIKRIIMSSNAVTLKGASSFSVLFIYCILFFQLASRVVVIVVVVEHFCWTTTYV